MRLALCSLVLALWSLAQVNAQINLGDTWKYYPTSGLPAAEWNSLTYDDLTWSSGAAPLGFSAGESTTLSMGQTTYYFRKEVTLDAGMYSFTVSSIFDDGIIVYINGVELTRSNMPGGDVTDTTLATSTINGAEETQLKTFVNLGPVTVEAGTSVVAVEVHQASTDSTDLSIDLQMSHVVAPSPSPSLFAPIQTAITMGDVWKYEDTGTDLHSSTWKQITYDDAAWGQGNARLGFNSDETTTIRSGPSGARRPTTYFRKIITIPGDASTEVSFEMDVQCDDGAVVYINGVEVARRNMPDGPTAYTTLSATSFGPDEEEAVETFFGLPGVLTGGTSVVAVEVHQGTATSSDLLWDGSLRYSVWPTPSPAPTPSVSPTISTTPTISETPTISVTPTVSPSPVSASPSPTNSIPASASPSPSFVAPSDTPTSTASSSPAPSPSRHPDAFAVVALGGAWRYLDSLSPLPTDWNLASLDDSTWSAGVAPLGFGIGGEAATLTAGSVTYYLRQPFNFVLNPDWTYTASGYVSFDDGFVMYLNGVEIARANMPPGAVTASTFAIATVGGTAETALTPFSVPASALVDGANVLAVEVHQATADSSDLRFDMGIDFVPALRPTATATTSPSAAPSPSVTPSPATPSVTPSVTPTASTVTGGSGCTCSCTSLACCGADVDTVAMCGAGAGSSDDDGFWTSQNTVLVAVGAIVILGGGMCLTAVILRRQRLNNSKDGNGGAKRASDGVTAPPLSPASSTRSEYDIEQYRAATPVDAGAPPSPSPVPVPTQGSTSNNPHGQVVMANVSSSGGPATQPEAKASPVNVPSGLHMVGDSNPAACVSSSEDDAGGRAKPSKGTSSPIARAAQAKHRERRFRQRRMRGARNGHSSGAGSAVDDSQASTASSPPPANVWDDFRRPAAQGPPPPPPPSAQPVGAADVVRQYQQFAHSIPYPMYNHYAPTAPASTQPAPYMVPFAPQAVPMGHPSAAAAAAFTAQSPPDVEGGFTPVMMAYPQDHSRAVSPSLPSRPSSPARSSRSRSPPPRPRSRGPRSRARSRARGRPRRMLARRATSRPRARSTPRGRAMRRYNTTSADPLSDYLNGESDGSRKPMRRPAGRRRTRRRPLSRRVSAASGGSRARNQRFRRSSYADIMGDTGTEAGSVYTEDDDSTLGLKW